MAKSGLKSMFSLCSIKWPLVDNDSQSYSYFKGGSIVFWYSGTHKKKGLYFKAPLMFIINYIILRF